MSKQNVLYNRRKKIVETFIFEINKGGELLLFDEDNLSCMNSDWTVEIEFIDGRFSQVIMNIPQECVGTRSYYRLMTAIDEEIRLIENKHLEE